LVWFEGGRWADDSHPVLSLFFLPSTQCGMGWVGGRKQAAGCLLTGLVGRIKGVGLDPRKALASVTIS